MKAFLLAAGAGTRLRPLTDHVPKCLIPIGGKPLLAIWLEQLERLGVTEARLLRGEWEILDAAGRPAPLPLPRTRPAGQRRHHPRQPRLARA